MNIKTPTLLINHNIVESNIKKMLNKISDPKKLRPHFKTHQSIEIGDIFKKYGVNKITVSSVKMAKYFSDYWDDITIAFPVNLFEIEDIVNLSETINLNILVESTDVLFPLENRLNTPIGIFIKIDTGYNRTGLQSDNPEIEKIITEIRKSKKLVFKGFLTHAGNTYQAKGSSEILNILERNYSILKELKNRFKDQKDLIISYGDTPSCSLASNLDIFDEIRPGNFVYYDVMQYHIGSCKFEDIAVTVTCPVVAIHPERNEIVIFGGAVHFSKDHISANNDFKLFGYIVEFKNKVTYDSSNVEKEDLYWRNPVTGVYLKNLSQEHGIIAATDEYINKTTVGDLIGVLPIHSCLTANLLKDNQILL